MRDQRLDSHQPLLHISKAIDDIFKYVSDETVNTFCEKDIIHDAVLFQFSIIGEAINFVDAEILEKYNYPWYKVRSFRNLISHEHFNIKLATGQKETDIAVVLLQKDKENEQPTHIQALLTASAKGRPLRSQKSLKFFQRTIASFKIFAIFDDYVKIILSK